MGDIEFKGSGKILVFLNFEHLLQDIDEEAALNFLDILEYHSRENLLFGDRLITILQTNNTAIEIQGFGAGFVKWDGRSNRSMDDKDIKIYEYKRD